MSANETNNNKTIRCSFCGRDEKNVEFLIPSPLFEGAYICGDCIDACERIIEDNRRKN